MTRRGIHLSASRTACWIVVVRAARRWEVAEDPRVWDVHPYGQISGMQTFTCLKWYSSLSAAGVCNAKESFSLGDERVYVGAFLFFRAQVISLNALHGPFISLLSSEVQQNSLIPHFESFRITVRKMTFL